MSEDKIGEDSEPWDVKRVKIELGDHSDNWLEAEVFHDREFCIQFFKGSSECSLEMASCMKLDVARRLRDFLNYAIPKT